MNKLKAFGINIFYTLAALYSMVAGSVNIAYHKIKGDYRY